MNRMKDQESAFSGEDTEFSKGKSKELDKCDVQDEEADEGRTELVTLRIDEQSPIIQEAGEGLQAVQAAGATIVETTEEQPENIKRSFEEESLEKVI